MRKNSCEIEDSPIFFWTNTAFKLKKKTKTKKTNKLMERIKQAKKSN